MLLFNRFQTENLFDYFTLPNGERLKVPTFETNVNPNPFMGVVDPIDTGTINNGDSFGWNSDTNNDFYGFEACVYECEECGVGEGCT